MVTAEITIWGVLAFVGGALAWIEIKTRLYPRDTDLRPISSLIRLLFKATGLVPHAKGVVGEQGIKTLGLEPEDRETTRERAGRLFDQEDWPALLTLYNDVIFKSESREEVVEAFRIKGFVLDHKMSLPANAAEHYEKSLVFDPAQPFILLLLAEIALRDEDWFQAGTLAERGLALEDVETAPGVQANLHLVRAIVAQGYEDHARLEEAASAAMVADSELSDVLSEVLASRRQLQEIGEELAAKHLLHDLLRDRIKPRL